MTTADDLTQTKLTQTNKAFIERVFDAINTGNGEVLAKAYAPDMQFWVLGSLPILSGHHERDFLKVLTRSNPKSFPNGWSLTITGITAEGERVAVEAEANGQHSSGKLYENKFHFLFIVRDEQIVMWKEYMDTMHANDVLLSDGAIANYD